MIQEFNSAGEMRTANKVYAIIKEAKQFLEDAYGDDAKTYKISNIIFF